MATSRINPLRSGFLTLLGVLLLSLVWSQSSQSQEIHSQHCLLGCPYGSGPTNDLIIRDIYILSSNDDTKLADWVAYRVDPLNFGKKRTRDWREDPWLDASETLERSDYRKAHSLAGYDRGHQAPLGSFSASRYWYQTNYLSNITPQRSALNQGPWRVLEQRIRSLARRSVQGGKGILYVMTGPIYAEPRRAQAPRHKTGGSEPHVKSQEPLEALKEAFKRQPFAVWGQKSWWAQLASSAQVVLNSRSALQPKELQSPKQGRLPSADEEHRIPSHYWKVVAVQGWPTIKVAAFIMPQTAGRRDSICDYAVPLAEVERATGLTFYHRLGTVEKAVLAARRGYLGRELGCR